MRLILDCFWLWSSASSPNYNENINCAKPHNQSQLKMSQTSKLHACKLMLSHNIGNIGRNIGPTLGLRTALHRKLLNLHTSVAVGKKATPHIVSPMLQMRVRWVQTRRQTAEYRWYIPNSGLITHYPNDNINILTWKFLGIQKRWRQQIDIENGFFAKNWPII